MPEYRIPNLANACRLLKKAAELDGMFTVGEMATHLGIPRTTVLRIMHTLAKEGFLLQSGSRFQLSGVLFSLGLKAGSSIPWEAVADPVLEELANKTIETAHIAVWDRDAIVLVGVKDSPHPLRMASRPGSRAHAHASATGKVLLAYCFPDKLGTIWPASHRKKLTPSTITTVGKLQKELREVLRRGYAIDDEEYFEGVRCLAAPVFDFQDRVCAAVGITASASRFTPRRNNDIAEAVTDAARNLSRVLKNSFWTSRPQTGGIGIAAGI